MTELINKDKIKKLLLTSPFDVVGGQAHFSVFEDMGLFVVASYTEYADMDRDDIYDKDSYRNDIWNVSLEDAEETFSKTIPFDEEDLKKLSFNEDEEDKIRDNYLES